MVKRRDDVSIQEEALAGQIPEYTEQENLNEENIPNEVTPTPAPTPTPTEESTSLGKKLNMYNSKRNLSERAGSHSHLGENVFSNAEARDGWIPVDRQLLQGRNKFYPEDWQFYIRPATVEVVRNWSMLDENNGNSIDDVFNEIIKYCLSIKTATGSRPWHEINHWDRFFFVLLIRQYTFVEGESKVEYFEDCSSCDSSVKFTLDVNALMYDEPEDDVLQYYDPFNRTWTIDPTEYDIPSDNPIVLYIPTLERDANIKAWMIAEYQENNNKKFDNVFIKFLPWLCPKISKDTNIAKTQIRKAEMTFKSWNSEMFSFMDDVLKNISVMPATTIKSVCDSCGEEVTAKLRFPDGVGALFNMVNKRKKFGTK